MRASVIYDSLYGHTRQIADVIGEVLADRYSVSVLPATPFTLAGVEGSDLLVIGGPTHGHGMSAPLQQLLSGLGRGSLIGVPAATFDTRIAGPCWLWGSAAAAIAERLQCAGCRLVLPRESFLVGLRKESPLRPGELERAADWARRLLTASLPEPASRQAVQ
jgi:flavodoxin I